MDTCRVGWSLAVAGHHTGGLCGSVSLRDHSVEEGLKEVALYNSAFLISEELDRALKRVQARKTPHTRAKL